MKYIQPKSYFFVFLLLCFLTISCNKKQYICPAYMTYFIHDNKVCDKMYMPFEVDSLSDLEDNVSSSNETNYNDSTKVESQDETGNSKASKYHPKEVALISKKIQPNGLVIGKKKKLINDVEMKFVMAKPMAQFSNAELSNDSTSAPIAPSDTL